MDEGNTKKKGDIHKSTAVNNRGNKHATGNRGSEGRTTEPGRKPSGARKRRPRRWGVEKNGERGNWDTSQGEYANKPKKKKKGELARTDTPPYTAQKHKSIR